MSIPATGFLHRRGPAVRFHSGTPDSRRIRGALKGLPPSIQGRRGSDALFRAALLLMKGFMLSWEEALPYLREWNAACSVPAWSEAELLRKLREAACATRVPDGYCLKAPDGRRIPGEAPAAGPLSAPVPRGPAWPVRDYSAMEAAGLSACVCDFHDCSPVRPEGGPEAAEEIIDALFCPCGDNPLLCTGTRVSRAVTAPRESLRGALRDRQFIVPSPMIAPAGRTQSGGESARCLANTGPRRFLVVECDFARDRAAAPPEDRRRENALLDAVEAAGRTVQDLCASILLRLAAEAPLALVVSSGGKSLHGWFYCAGIPEETLRAFMRLAVRLGADPATWTPCQWVRMPWGRRRSAAGVPGALQTVHFFNPQILSRPSCPI